MSSCSWYRVSFRTNSQWYIVLQGEGLCDQYMKVGLLCKSVANIMWPTTRTHDIMLICDTHTLWHLTSPPVVTTIPRTPKYILNIHLNIKNYIAAYICIREHVLTYMQRHICTYLFSVPSGNMRRSRMACMLKHILQKANKRPIGAYRISSSAHSFLGILKWKKIHRRNYRSI